MKRRTPVLIVVVVAVVAALAGLAWRSRGEGSTNAAGERRERGGILTLAAAQEPACADWIGSCAATAWGYWTLGAATMPRAFDVNAASRYVRGAAMAVEPRLQAGPPQRVTYRIRSDAVWSDGHPISAHDFKYTWDEILRGQEVSNTGGYEKIAHVDDTNPKVAVVTFSEPFAAWRDLFSAYAGILPSHLLEGKDRAAVTRDGYRWSGGPWVIEQWTKGREARLIPNRKYWGEKPAVDAVVFKFLTEPSSELEAYATGRAVGGSPPAQVDRPAQLAPGKRIDVQASESLSYEGLWFNTEAPPLNDRSVRQALATATDRHAIVAAINGPYLPESTALQAFAGPALDRRYVTPAFQRYTRDVARVGEIMRRAGWAMGPDGVWGRAGQRASLTITTTAGNKARERVEELLREQWKEAGFEVKVDNTTLGDLFDERLPKGRYQVAMYAQMPTLDPGQCHIWCSKNVPGPGNLTGENFTRIKSPALDRFWLPAETELDDTPRAEFIRQGMDALAEEVPALPLYGRLSLVVAGRSVGGPVGDNFILGPFWNVHQWFLKKPA